MDVTVVGAGLTGITTAYLLKRAGLKVALVDRRRCASIDTGNTTAHLTCALDTPLTDLVESFGEDHARAAWDAGFAAIAQIDEIVRSERIDCHFAWVPGYLHCPANVAPDNQAAALVREASQARTLGFDAKFCDRVPLFERPGVELNEQARFHPRLYLAALASAIEGDGSYVFEETAIEEVREPPLTARTDDHTITCDYIVIATHSPLIGKAGVLTATILQTKLSLYTSYAIAARVPSGRVPDALFWDTGDPYYYLRLEPTGDDVEVIFGGEDHKTGQVDDTRQCFDRLERKLKDLLPGCDVTRRWSGQVIETADGLPFIGEMAPRQFIATGFSGNGMTFGTVAAMMARDAILGRSNPWKELFDTGRTRIRAGAWDYIKENKDYPYYLIRDRFAGPERRTLRGMARRTGSIVPTTARSCCDRRSARTWPARCAGIRPSARGIARVTGRDSRRTDAWSPVRRSRRSRTSNRADGSAHRPSVLAVA